MKKLALYDVTKNFQENIENISAFDDIPDPIIPPEDTWSTLFDYPVASLVGIAACPVTANAHGVAVASKLGYSIITFKTIRSRFHPAHNVPNLTPVQINRFINRYDMDTIWDASDACPQGWCSWSNSIGNASGSLESSLQEIAQAKAAMHKGQVLIVSIFGTGDTEQQLIDDFVLLAREVACAGADIIELNCSCPNVTGIPLYQENELLYRIVRNVTRAVSLPVVVKVGIALDLEPIVHAVAQAGGVGIVGINSVPGRVINQNNEPFFGDTRIISGMSGDPIRLLALAWLREVKKIIKRCRYNLTVLATGGITRPKHFDLFLHEGADAALTATGAMNNPLLAHEYQMMKYANIKGRYEQGKEI